MKKQHGKAALPAIIIVVLVIAGGVYFLTSGTDNPKDQDLPATTNKQNNSAAEKMTEGEAMEDDSGQAPFNGLVGPSESLNPSGGDNVQAYYDAEFERGITEARGAALVVYYFYADWCPLCKKEFPELIAAMDELADKPVLAFRVNFKDSDITEDGEALAREHGVAYQHTKVFLKDGERILKSPETWTKARYIEEINKALK